MQKIIRIQLSFLFLLFIACKSSEKYLPAESAIDCGRIFIDACLKGEFKKAANYIITDDINKQKLRDIENDFKGRSSQDKQGFKNASINIISIEDISQQETIINYSNSFDKVARKVKIISKEGKWLVDFKYSFNGNL